MGDREGLGAGWPRSVGGVRQEFQPIHPTEPVANHPNPAEFIHPTDYKPQLD